MDILTGDGINSFYVMEFHNRVPIYVGEEVQKQERRRRSSQSSKFIFVTARLSISFSHGSCN